VEVSPDLVETAPGVLLVLRPRSWEPSAEGALVCREEALHQVRVGGLLDRIRQALADTPATRGELAARLAGPGGDAEAAARQVDQLVDAGVLAYALPWSDAADHLEGEMLRALRALPAGARPDALVDALRRLVDGEAAWADAPDPAAARAALDDAAAAPWRAAAPLAGLPADTPGAAHAVYEDVWLRGDGEGGTVFELSRRHADDALRAAEPLVRLASLFDRRHDLQRTLAALAAEMGFAEDGVSALELFRAVRPHWRGYRAARAAARGGDRAGAWNPLELPEVEALASARAEVLAGLDACLRRDGDEQRICPEALAALLDRAGGEWATAEGGACLFIQPADAAGRRWVLNRLREGTGRFGSRYTPAMDELTQRRYTAHLAARGTVTVHGEPAELLDLGGVQGDTLNVHAPQTPAVLRRAGETPRPSAAARLRLAELRVTFRGGRATLRGPGGQALAPVYLGVAGEPYFPPLVRFLAAFGPSSLAPVLPPACTREAGGVTVTLRAVLGPLVVRRAAWTVGAAPLAAMLAGTDDAGAFAALCRWRDAHGIPARVFLDEPSGAGRTRPQYLDLTSPWFASLLRAAVHQAAAGTLTLVEALPDAGDLPRDAAGRPWAVEVLLDSLALRVVDRCFRGIGERARDAGDTPPAALAGTPHRARAGSPSLEAV
jgi:hypothetical protein